MIKAFTASLSLRLLGIFIITAILIIVILIGLFSTGLRSQWRRSIQPHLVQYAQYVQQDLGSPPQLERAEALARKLPVDIYIYQGSQFQFSTTSEPLTLSTLTFRPVNKRLLRSGENQLTANGLRVSISGRNEAGQGIFKIEENGYSVYYDLHPHAHDSPHRARGNRLGNELILALLALAIVLTASYFLIRWQLFPIRQMKASVRRMASGELDHRIDRRGHGDLDRLAQSIDSMAEQIQAMLDAKRQLLIAISHELRSPLTRARITTELLPDTTNKERLLNDLVEMNRMISDIMESEQLQNNHTVLNLETFDIGALLDDEAGKLLPGLQLQQSQPGKAINFSGDAARLRILLRNLVTNALQHGRAEDGTVDVRVLLEESDTHVILCVTDKGKGIEQQHLDRLTAPFYRPDASRSRETGGFGLGLFLARLIAEAHGGTLTIHSTPAEQPGTRVRVSLPRQRVTPSTVV